MNEIESALAAHAFFRGLEPRSIAAIAPLTTWSEYGAGRWIARLGGTADRFLAVVDGRAGIEIAAADREPILVATVHAGEVIGWSWSVEPYRWRFDVVALDAVRALSIDAVGLRAACEADHELGYQLTRRLARVVAARLEATRLQLVDVYGRSR